MWFHYQAMGWVRCGFVAVVFTAVVGGGCTADRGRSPSEAADWAGFTQRHGLEITTAEDVGRLDAAVDFTLEGSAADIESALAAAGFRTAFLPGMDPVQQSLFDGETDDLVDVESAADEWRHAGTTIHRHVVIGSRGDEVVLRVSAFTT